MATLATDKQKLIALGMMMISSIKPKIDQRVGAGHLELESD